MPFALRESLKIKLDSMEEQGVIKKVDKPTEWVHNLVIVEKKDKSLRICLDPRNLNICVKREHYQIPVLEDITSQLSGKHVFSVIDLKEAFWQIPLTEESMLLTTFSTPFGRYCFTRMPFGICSASEVLQKRAYQTFGDIPDVHIIADDMILASENEKEHDHLITTVLERARANSIKFNLHKIQLKKSEVTYMGNIIGNGVVKPDYEKVRAIVEMPAPTCKKDIQRLLGMLNYLSQYIPNMSTITVPLRNLLKKDVPFEWNFEQEQAFEKIKSILSSPESLRIYDPMKPLQIECDSSKFGIGACLLQEDKPVAYYSKALTPAEINWFPIEKECLAIVCAAERFRHFIYGKDVEVKSDQKPLETITKKSVHDATPRIQAMLLRLMRYNLYVNYKPGPTMYISDTLSRAYVENSSLEELEVETSQRVHTLVANLPVSPDRLKRIREETQKDECLSKLSENVIRGWPKYHKDCHPLIRQYWPIRGEITSIDGILYYNSRIVIPMSLRQEMLRKVHETHLGMDKCKSRARLVVYWPSMCQEINDMIAECSVCAKFRKANQREPLIPHEIPALPWQKVGADIFDFGRKTYLIIVDYFSKFPEVCLLQKGKTAGIVIKHFKSIFSRHGIPEILIADNVPFNSFEMKRFAREFGFQMKTSSPEYPQSNG